MTSISQLSKLFKAISARDWGSVEAIAREIAEKEADKGHHSAAKQLRGCLNPNGRKSELGNQVSALTDSGLLLRRALSSANEQVHLEDVVLRPQWRTELETVVKEWKSREQLAKNGLKRRSELLFHGPPGCGKSFTAKALGHALGLPTYVVRFDSVIGSYLGQTSGHLRELFEFAEMTPCVLLLDEVDALGKKRGNPLDVGELDRIVIALMQELEHTTPMGLIVATSNLPTHLDSALWRRFDVVVDFPSPSRSMLLQFAKDSAIKLNIKFDASLKRNLVQVSSFSDALRTVEDAARRAVLSQAGGSNCLRKVAK